MHVCASEAGGHQGLEDRAVILEILDVFTLVIGDSFGGQPIKGVRRQIAADGLVGHAPGDRLLGAVGLQGAGDVLGRRRPATGQNEQSGGQRESTGPVHTVTL